MAITLSTDRLDGLAGRTIDNIYTRIQSVTVQHFDTGGGGSGTDPMFKLHYEVAMFGSASIRNSTGEYPEWRNRMRCREIDRFTCEVTLANMDANGANNYKLAYADLKARLAVDDPPVATNIADAV